MYDVQRTIFDGIWGVWIADVTNIAGGFWAPVCFFAGKAMSSRNKATRELLRSWVEFLPTLIHGVFWIMHLPLHANYGLAETRETSDQSNVNW